MLDSADTVFGMNYRNLTAVQVLGEIVTDVEQKVPAPVAPATPASPFVAAIYQAILQRPADTGQCGEFQQRGWNQGISADVVTGPADLADVGGASPDPIGQYYR